MGTSKFVKGEQKLANGASSSKTASKHHSAKRKSIPSTANDELPGVQKIKAALRQTKRLLQKEDLAADVRVTTERRLKSLEADLAKAELARIERTMAVRYHKVKFFERQKVVRKINQTKRLLESGQDADGQPLKKKQRKELEKKLFDKRVDLNYIIHYSKTSKYISLYPKKSKGEDEDEEEDSHMISAETEGASQTDQKREEWRNTMREAMKAGEMSNEPELELVDRPKDTKKPTLPASSRMVENQGMHKKDRQNKSKATPAATGVESDDFFEV